jgi:hypothetical protein
MFTKSRLLPFQPMSITTILDLASVWDYCAAASGVHLGGWPGAKGEGHMRATRSPMVHAGIAGFKYQTHAVQDSTHEVTLQKIQAELADGKVLIGSNDPVAQLMLADTVDGDSAIILLWVPGDQKADAERLLIAAGFEVVPSE